MSRGIGFFSDVHSNLPALREMREVIHRRHDLVWYFGGDVLGWLDQAQDCAMVIKGLMQFTWVRGAVLGDHDLEALGRLENPPDQEARRRAAAYSSMQIFRSGSARLVDFLADLPLSICDDKAGCMIAHHSPFCAPDPLDAPNKKHFPHLPVDFEAQLAPWSNCRRQAILTGHDHIGAIHRILRGLPNPTLRDVATKFCEDTETVPLHPDYNYLVQAPACGGPPRDGVLEIGYVEYVPGECIIMHRIPSEVFDFSGTRELIDRGPFPGSLMTWERFSDRTDSPIAQGANVRTGGF